MSFQNFGERFFAFAPDRDVNEREFLEIVRRFLGNLRAAENDQAVERKRVSGSDCVIDTATAQASAPLLWGTGAELAVAGSGDGAGWAEAGCGA